MDKNILYLIGLKLIPNIGDILAKKLIAWCGGPEEIFRERKAHLLKIPGIGDFHANGIIKQSVLKRAEEELTFIDRYKIDVLTYLDDAYPDRLKQCLDGPVIIFVKGDHNFNRKKVLSIVGTRKPTEYGREMVNFIIEGLKDKEILITSGLAYGIDIAAHRSAMNHGFETSAVLGHGLDRIYPFAHKPYAEKIISSGGLISEFMKGTMPDRENFPKRNRIVAGIADATLVVEATTRGGALITAEIANSYSRDVFAVPGRTGDECSAGCNILIKQNKAALIENAGDIETFMNWNQPVIEKQMVIDYSDLSDLDGKIMEILQQKKEIQIDDLMLHTGLQPQALSAKLLEMEFRNLVDTLPGKRYRICRK